MSYTKRTTRHLPNVKTGIASDAGHVTTVESGNNATAVPSANGGINVSTDVSVSPNDHGSLSYTKRTTRHIPATGQATSALPTERSTTVVSINTPANPNASFGHASLSLNDHGSKTTSVTTITPIAISSGWRTWKRTVRSTRGTYTYNCGMIVFRNQKTIPAMPGAHDYHPSISINQYGLFDGTITYADLRTFEEAGQGQFGGWAEGHKTIDGVRYNTITFYGTGNQGAEAQAAANSIEVKGLSLPHRTYILS